MPNNPTCWCTPIRRAATADGAFKYEVDADLARTLASVLTSGLSIGGFDLCMYALLDKEDVGQIVIELMDGAQDGLTPLDVRDIARLLHTLRRHHLGELLEPLARFEGVVDWFDLEWEHLRESPV